MADARSATWMRSEVSSASLDQVHREACRHPRGAFNDYSIGECRRVSVASVSPQHLATLPGIEGALQEGATCGPKLNG